MSNLDLEPWAFYNEWDPTPYRSSTKHNDRWVFDPRSDYSQDRKDYV